jgi:hypothetical protein
MQSAGVLRVACVYRTVSETAIPIDLLAQGKKTIWTCEPEIEGQRPLIWLVVEQWPLGSTDGMRGQLEGDMAPHQEPGAVDLPLQW